MSNLVSWTGDPRQDKTKKHNCSNCLIMRQEDSACDRCGLTGKKINWPDDICCPLTPVKLGEWAPEGSMYDFDTNEADGCICSACNELSMTPPTKYCPNCGAKMTEAQPQKEGE